MNAVADFRVENHGSIVILQAQSEAAQAWAAEHLCNEETQHWGPHGTVIEPRYLNPILDGIADDGLDVEY